jgi:hypothetical protein
MTFQREISKISGGNIDLQDIKKTIMTKINHHLSDRNLKSKHNSVKPTQSRIISGRSKYVKQAIKNGVMR